MLCEEGFYWIVTIVEHIEIKYQDRWICDFQSSVILLFFFLNFIIFSSFTEV